MNARRRLDRWPTLSRRAVAYGLALVALAFVPVLPTTAFLPFFIASSALTALLVISLNIVIGYTGLLSLGHTGLFMAGAYVSAILALETGLSPWLTMPVAVVGTGLLGAVIAAVSLRSRSLYFAIITLAFNLVLVEVVRQLDITGGSQGLFGVPRPAIGGSAMSDTEMYYLVLLTVAGAFAVQHNLVHSATGRAFRAVRDSPGSAAALGIPTFATQVRSFAYSAVIAGAAGALFAHLNGFVVYTLGELRGTLVLFLGLFLGGLGTIDGPLLGTGVVTIVQQLLAKSPENQALLFGLLMLASIVIVPGGVVGTWARRSRRSAPSKAQSVPAASGSGIHVSASRAVAPRPPHPPHQGIASAGAPAIHVSARVTTPVAAVPALAARGVSKRFGGVQALRDVDVTVVPASIHGLIGPNGSGKSTFCDCLTRVRRMDAGEVRLFGMPLPARPVGVAAAGLVRVFQVPHLFEGVSVAENVMTGMYLDRRQHDLGAVLRTRGFRRDERRLHLRALDLLAVTGLVSLADAPTSILSHGQKRLVEVVRAVSADPRLLVLDEPATGLTTAETERLAELLLLLRAQGLTVLLIEHNLSLIMDLCSRVTVFDGGIRIAEGTPDAVSRSEHVQRAYLDDVELELEPSP